MSDDSMADAEFPVDESPVDRDPGLNALPDTYVPIYDSPDFETAEIVCATLASEGIHARMQNPSPGPASNALPFLGATWSHGIYVAPEDVEAAKAILASPPPTDEELAAEQAADPTTLEQAERNVRNA